MRTALYHFWAFFVISTVHRQFKGNWPFAKITIQSDILACSSPVRTLRVLAALIPFLTALCGFPAASLSITGILKIADTPFYNFSPLPYRFNQNNTEKSVITPDRK
nr:MAG TPA: hypothetical protein [Caudoviricetes sp.]